MVICEDTGLPWCNWKLNLKLKQKVACCLFSSQPLQQTSAALLLIGSWGTNLAQSNVDEHLDIIIKRSFETAVCKMAVIIPCFNEVERGVYTGFTLSVRLSICRQNRARSVSSTILVGSISYLHMLSGNFRRCVASKVCSTIQNYEILANSLNF